MTRWSSRSLGSRFQHGFFFALIGLGGRRAAYVLLFWVILWYMCKPEAIRRSTAYLTRRFPEAGRLERWKHRWRLQWELGKTLIDRAVSGISGQFDLRMDVSELKTLRTLHREGKGLILLASHIGCWHVSMQGLPKSMTAPMAVVLYRDAGDYDRHYFEHQGKLPPFTIIDPSEGPSSAVAMVQTLQRGGLLCLMGDRPFGDVRVCKVPFLGGIISVPYTAYFLASVTGAPLVVFFSYRVGPSMGRNVLSKIIRMPGGLGKQPEAYVPYARQYAEALEESVTMAPYQFFNFFNMWDADEYQGQTQGRAD